MRSIKKHALNSDSIVTTGTIATNSIANSIEVLQHYSRGLALIENGKYSKAIKAFSRAIEESLNQSDVLWNSFTQRARCYLMCQDYSRCVADCNVVLSNNPKDQNALELLAQANKHTSLEDSSTLQTVDLTEASEESLTMHSNLDFELDTITCSRCRAVVAAGSAFCLMCGGPLNKTHKQQQQTKKKSEQPNKKKNQPVKINNSSSYSKQPKKDRPSSSSEVVHSIPAAASEEEGESDDQEQPTAAAARGPVMPFESQLMELLNRPALTREQAEQQRRAFLRSNQLELDNALLLEEAAQSMLRDQYRHTSSSLSGSVAMSLPGEDSRVSLPAIKGARPPPPQQQPTKRQKVRREHSKSSGGGSSSLRRPLGPALIDNYLEEVGSIRSQFDSFVSRTYEYQGLRAAVRERLVPLEKRPFHELELKQGVEGEFSDTIRPRSKLLLVKSGKKSSGGTAAAPSEEQEEEQRRAALVRGYDLEEDSRSTTLYEESVAPYSSSASFTAASGNAAAAAAAVSESEAADEEEEELLNEGVDYQPQSIHEGSAFLWGPLFDTTNDFSAGGSLEAVRQREDEERQYSLRGDYEVSAEDTPLFRKETEAERREAGSEGRDIFYWGDLVNDNRPSWESEPVLEAGETPGSFDEEYLVSRLLRWNQGYVDSYTPPDTPSDSESEDEVIDLTVDEPATLTEKYEQAQREVNALTSDQMRLIRDLPRVTWDDLPVVEQLEDSHAADREEYAGKDEDLIMSVKNDVIAINEARDAVFLARQGKMERFERQMKRDIRHAKRKLRKFERQRWKETVKSSTQLYIQSVLHSGVVGGDPSLLATLPEPVEHEAIYELLEDNQSDIPAEGHAATAAIAEGATVSAAAARGGVGASGSSFTSSSVGGSLSHTSSFAGSAATFSRQGSAVAGGMIELTAPTTAEVAQEEELVSKQMLRLADKLTHTNDEALLISIENTRKHHRKKEEQQDLVKTHTEDQVTLKLIQNERELTEMQRRVDMLNVEKLIDSDRLVEHPEKLDEQGLKDLSDEIQTAIQQQTKDQQELTATPHNLTDDEAYIYGIESNMLKIRLMTETLDYQRTIMNMQIGMNQNQRERDIHELTRKIGAIRAENVVKLENFTRMVDERERERAAQRRQKEQQLWEEQAAVNQDKKAERRRRRREQHLRRKQEQQQQSGEGAAGDDSESRPGTAFTTDGSTGSNLTSPRYSEAGGLLTGRTDGNNSDEDDSVVDPEAFPQPNDYCGSFSQQAAAAAAEGTAEKPSIFLDETTDMLRVEQLEASQVMQRSSAEETDVESIRQMQQTLNQFELSREAIGHQRSRAGEYFDIGALEAPLSELDLLLRQLQQRSQRQLAEELCTLDIIQAPDLIEMIDDQIVSMKKNDETQDADVINHTFSQFNQLQAYRDLTEKHKEVIREVEEGRLDSLPLDEDGDLKPPTEEDLLAAQDLVPLSMIRDVAEIVRREMSQLLQRRDNEAADDESLQAVQSSLRAVNQTSEGLSLARHTALGGIDEGCLLQEPERVPTPPPAARRVLTVAELAQLYGEEDTRELSEAEVEDRQRQVEISELKLSEADAVIQSIESSHSQHRHSHSLTDAEFLFSQLGDIQQARSESESVEKARRIEAVELEQALVIGNPSAFAGQSNAELASLRIARDAEKLELLEKTLVFKRTIEEARDDVTLAGNVVLQEQQQRTREQLHQSREQALEAVEKDVEQENQMIAEKIEQQARMKKKHRMKEAILYNNTLQDEALVKDQLLEYSLGTEVKNLVVADDLSLEMKVEHAEIIQRSQDELADQHRIDGLLKDFDRLQVTFDEQAYQRQVVVEQLYDEAGIVMLGDDEEEQQTEPEASAAETAVEEVVVKPYISKRRQRREEALRNRVIPEKITVEVIAPAIAVAEAEPRERLLVVSEAELERYKQRRQRQLTTCNNLMAIKRLYSDSYERMKRAVEDLQIDFKVDPKLDVTSSSKALVALTRNKLMSAYDTLDDATKVNALVNAEYAMFQEQLNLRRTQATLDLAEAMAASGETERQFREKYAAAAREFKAAGDANEFQFVSATGKHITTSKQMDAIKAEAERALSKQGATVKALQAREAQLVLNIKQEEFVVQEIIKKWHPRHCEMIDKTSLAYRRQEGWLRDNVAGKKKSSL